ncbi:hypothetical protein BDV59DRAFT_42855 [Aspergillus ambiguus]|uniref:uncharacterized protein n=1 Tax=Aspergillus ambiguus TaxID=176160 RepID=UPI003CCDD8DE
MNFLLFLSIFSLAAFTTARSPSFDFEALQALQSDQGDVCFNIAEQLLSLRTEYESFAQSVSGYNAVSYLFFQTGGKLDR